MRLFRALALAGPAALLACAHAVRTAPDAERGAALAARVDAPRLLVEVLYTPADAAEAEDLRKLLLEAGPQLSRWGSFRQGITLRVLPDHEAFEAAANRRGYPWLRAWTFPDQVLLQSPRSWSAQPGPARDQDVLELLVHELTHALMYQLMEPARGPVWSVEEPPAWFREGMASVTAGQEHLRLPREELARWAAAHPDADLLHPSEELYRTCGGTVYAAAHRAFELLLATSGEGSVRDLLQRISQGAPFSEAFLRATGRPLAQFENDVVRGGFAAPAQASVK
ncbi:MAG TPA: hypothetical protein VI356_00115 [Myxococcales bacterium]